MDGAVAAESTESTEVASSSVSSSNSRCGGWPAMFAESELIHELIVEGPELEDDE